MIRSLVVGRGGGEHEVGGMERESDNIRFLIEQQVELLHTLGRSGRIDWGAHELLRRLMRRDEEVRWLRAGSHAGAGPR